MRVNTVKLYCLNVNVIESSHYKKSDNYTQKPDIFFRSAPATNIQQEARQLFLNPKYGTSLETFRKIFDNVTRYLSAEARQKVVDNRGWGLYNDTPIIIKNKPQLKFLEHVLAYNMEPDHPMIKTAHFNYDLYLAGVLNHIETEENADASSRAFDFFMKHPENIFDSDTVKRFLLYNKKDRNKDYIEFIDNNYDTITQKLCISNKKLMEHLYRVNSNMYYDFNSHYGKNWEKLWNVLMGKEDILEVSKNALPKNEIKNHSQYYFDNWYLKDSIKDSKKAQKTVQELRQTIYHYKTGFPIVARNLGEIFEHDENITVPELYLAALCCGAGDVLRKTYELAGPRVSTYKWEKINYNENNRKLLWYLARDTETNDEIKKCFLNKFVLESIKTPEHLATVMKLYNEFSDNNKKPIVDKWSMSTFLEYNLGAEDILKINEEAEENYLKLSLYQYLVKSGQFNKKPIEKQLEIWPEVE